MSEEKIEVLKKLNVANVNQSQKKDACCGGAPVDDSDACCKLDEDMKSKGESGCGCNAKSEEKASSCC